MTARELLAGVNDIYGGAGTFTMPQLDALAESFVTAALAEERANERERIIRLIALAHSKYQLDLGPMEAPKLIHQIRETAP